MIAAYLLVAAFASQSMKEINIMNMLAFGVPGPSEWVLILVIVLVLFGAKKLPELGAEAWGKSMNEFRKAREDFDKELNAAGNEVKRSGAAANTNHPPNQQPYQPQQKSAAAESTGGIAESELSSFSDNRMIVGVGTRITFVIPT